MSSTAHTKRLSCASCLRAQSACICQWIRPIEHQVEVLVLQHPLEVNQAKGSARLMCLSLQRSQLVTGEVFDDDYLKTLLTAPFQTTPDTCQPKQTVLLYPETQDTLPLGTPAAPVLTSAMLQFPSQLRLVVLDGTWRKSLKMLHLNPRLQQLPRMSLSHVPGSRYLIRKAQRPDQLSTLEATCTALMTLEVDPENFVPLLTAFDGFVAQQLGYRRSARPSANV